MRDPFGERPAKTSVRRVPLLGGAFEFRSSSTRLLRLVDEAYARLPRPRRAGRLPRFALRLELQEGESFSAHEPPQLRTRAGVGLICGTVTAADYAALHPQTRAGFLSLSREMLRFPYHARYELIEFAVFTLASRAAALAPLHAACVGSKGRALLLVGESGAGKSTLTLQCMRQGLSLLAEDAVFVDPRTLLARGIPNFLHLRRDSLRFVDDAELVDAIRKSPVIQRRSGIRKFEVDLRDGRYRITSDAMKLAAVIFVSPKAADASGLLVPVPPTAAAARLKRSQRYAAGLASWPPFIRSLEGVAAFELRRARHPREMADALTRLLWWGERHR